MPLPRCSESESESLIPHRFRLGRDYRPYCGALIVTSSCVRRPTLHTWTPVFILARTNPLQSSIWSVEDPPSERCPAVVCLSVICEGLRTSKFPRGTVAEFQKGPYKSIVHSLARYPTTVPLAHQSIGGFHVPHCPSTARNYLGSPHRPGYPIIVC